MISLKRFELRLNKYRIKANRSPHLLLGSNPDMTAEDLFEVAVGTSNRDVL